MEATSRYGIAVDWNAKHIKNIVIITYIIIIIIIKLLLLFVSVGQILTIVTQTLMSTTYCHGKKKTHSLRKLAHAIYDKDFFCKL